MTTHRFDDDGLRLAQLRATIDVRCPACGERAEVTTGSAERPARVVCGSCSFARTAAETGWMGPVRGSVRRRCGRCGQTIARTYPGPQHDHPAPIVCTCGWELQAEITWSPVPGIVDPDFGLDLWWQAPFRGEVLWAYNLEHLRFLEQYVGATLRHRQPHQNGSLASRLPAWITSAKNRDDLVATIRRLEADRRPR